MATTVNECSALIEQVTTRDVMVGVNHNFLFAPVYENLRQVFDSSPPVLAVSPFAMERQLYALASHGATPQAIFPFKLQGKLP